MDSKKISLLEGILLILFALSIDAAQGLGGMAFASVFGSVFGLMAWIYGIFGWLFLLLYFWMKGSSLNNKGGVGGILGWMLGAGIIEAIPIINVVPGITLGVVMTIIKINMGVAV